ncbi:MAG: hypothetical protein HYT62_01455 [Candidatus Yanofskybacteria bacterium]|nr:hypothetical protein [Candidatus Yanofskybacteria bacterium]
MLNTIKKIIYIIIIISIVALIFYLDKGMIIGSDTTTYMDLSYIIHRGGLLFIDYYDYRLPVFPYIFSFVYGLSFSDFTNRFIMHFFIYSFYAILIYAISIFLTKSKKISLLTSLITLVTITARQFDAGRNIAVPLFYHSLELLSVFLFIPVFACLLHAQERYRQANKIDTVYSVKKKIYLSALSGFIFSLAFWGRQVHIFPFFMMGLFLATNLLPKQFRLPIKHNLIFSFSFISAFILGSASIISISYNGSPNFFIDLKKWLIDVPRIGYVNGTDPLYDVLLRRVKQIILLGLPQFENHIYPIFWINFIAALTYLGKLLFLKNRYSAADLVDFFRKDFPQILLILFSTIIVVTSLIGTAYGSPRHLAPIISLHAILLSYTLGKLKFNKDTVKNPIFILIIIIFIFPQTYNFYRYGEKQSYAASRKQEGTKLFTYELADALSETLKERSNEVLILGGYSTVARLVDYKPFMGLNSDVFNYIIMPRLYGDNFINSFKQNLEKVDTAVILPDYPNTDWAGGNLNNEIYKITENYLSKNFKLQKTVKGENFYPLNPDLYRKGALIYIRKNTKIRKSP